MMTSGCGPNLTTKNEASLRSDFTSDKENLMRLAHGRSRVMSM